MSYSTIIEADAYFETRLWVQAWTSADDTTKQQALNDAARIINRFNFVGEKFDSEQSDEWPRKSIYMGCTAITGVPSDIKAAEYEIALALLNGVDPEKELRSLMVTSRGYSSVRITYDPRLTPEWLTNGVPSGAAWAYLLPYLVRDILGAIKLHRVN